MRYSTTKFASIREVNGQLFRCFLLASWQIRGLSYQTPVLREVFSLMRVSRRIYTGGIPEGLMLIPEEFMPTRCPGQAQAQTPPKI